MLSIMGLVDIETSSGSSSTSSRSGSCFNNNNNHHHLPSCLSFQHPTSVNTAAADETIVVKSPTSLSPDSVFHSLPSSVSLFFNPPLTPLDPPSSSTSVLGDLLQLDPQSPCLPTAVAPPTVSPPVGRALLRRSGSVQYPVQPVYSPVMGSNTATTSSGRHGGATLSRKMSVDTVMTSSSTSWLTSSTSSLNGGGADNSTDQTQQRYKTELCRTWAENGSCPYGSKCQFAHGRNELRTVSRHPKYKTEMCRTFHTTGYCPYGPRCHFIHNGDDLLLAPPHTSSGAGVKRQTSLNEHRLLQLQRHHNNNISLDMLKAGSSSSSCSNKVSPSSSFDSGIDTSSTSTSDVTTSQLVQLLSVLNTNNTPPITRRASTNNTTTALLDLLLAANKSRDLQQATPITGDPRLYKRSLSSTADRLMTSFPVDAAICWS